MIAYGYIRVEDADEGAIEALHDLITESSSAEGYSLKEIFVDRETAPDKIVRPGFQALSAELLVEEGARVLIVNMDHLSPLPAIRAALRAKLEALGSAVVTLGVTQS